MHETKIGCNTSCKIQSVRLESGRRLRQEGNKLTIHSLSEALVRLAWLRTLRIKILIQYDK